MPDAALFNATTSAAEPSPAMRKDSQSSLGSEPEIIIETEKTTTTITTTNKLIKKVSFRRQKSSRSTEVDDDEVFSTETKCLLKSSGSASVQRSASQRDAVKEERSPRRAAGRCCKRPKRSASFRDGLRQGESYQILMLGAVGVGKTSLVRQFQQANHCGSVSIQISNVYGDSCRRTSDAQLVIFDHPANEITAEMALGCCQVDAYVVVYSVTDRSSFKTAQHILKALSSTDDGRKNSSKAAILVGNKVDLVRRRVVSTEEGKSVATSNGCKFIETSDWIDYNVAELFNGVLAQIRLRSAEATADGDERRHGYRRCKTLGAKSWGVLKELINLINRKEMSCDDLQAL